MDLVRVDMLHDRRRKALGQFDGEARTVLKDDEVVMLSAKPLVSMFEEKLQRIVVAFVPMQASVEFSPQPIPETAGVDEDIVVNLGLQGLVPLDVWMINAEHRDVMKMVLVVVCQEDVGEVLNGSTLHGWHGQDS